MDGGIKHPDPLLLTGNTAENWRRWEQRFKLYLEAIGAHEKPDPRKRAILLHCVGEDALEVYNTFVFNQDDPENYANILNKFKNYCEPKKNIVFERYKFWQAAQGADQLFDQYITDLKNLAKNCEFANETDNMIRDKIVFGIRDMSLKERLLREPDLDLKKTADICRASETSKNQIRSMQAREVHAIKHSQTSCTSCGLFHSPKPEACPAYGDQCHGCGRMNHWKSVCRATQQQGYQRPTTQQQGYQRPRQQQRGPRGPQPAERKPQGKPMQQPNKQPQASGGRGYRGRRRQRPNQRIHTVETEDDIKTLYFDCIQVDDNQDKQPLVKLHVHSRYRRKYLLCKVDSGADGSILPVDTYKLLFPHSKVDEFGNPMGLRQSKTRIMAYGGSEVRHFGTCSLVLHHNGQQYRVPFHVTGTTGPVMLSRSASLQMKLISLHFALDMGSPLSTDSGRAKAQLLQEYPDCFQGVGCFEGEYHITLDKSVPPVVHPPRRVPVALQQPLRQEIDRLLDLGIIAKVDRPTDWVNSCVCVTKSDGSIRLCLDPKDLNQAIKRPHHYTPTLDDVLAKLNGAKYFTILDARCGYWNVKLDEESSYYTTFNTPFGRFRFLRLPFGVSCAQDIFQKKVDETFGDMPGVAGIADDVVIFGHQEDGSDHDANLRRVMERARQAGVKLNPEKARVKQRQIPFYGNILSADGLAPDTSKIEAITSMAAPTSLKELQTFLGMANYLSRFAPNLADVAAPLRELCKKDSEFVWGPEHQKCFEEVKTLISSPTVLKYFDENKPVTLHVDASTRGLGAALVQEHGVIGYASKTLSDTESRYSNIEREMLAVVYGLEHFHYYVYGRAVTVLTDHKPLESIAKKTLAAAPPRIARMLLRTQKYNATITYVPGKEHCLPDALSRNNPCYGETIPGLEVSVHEVYQCVNASATRINQVRAETDKDTCLATLKDVIAQGWPSTRDECPAHIHPYWTFRDELSVEDGVILKGTRLVIPKSLQPEVLAQIHYAHQGAEKCKLRAKASVYWPGINNDIDQMTKQCSPCQHHQRENSKETMIPHPVPPRAWHTLGTDLFYWNTGHYLIVADYFSKFPIIRKLNDLSSSTVIMHLKGIFEEHGIPEKVISDNGTQYSSTAFSRFAQEYGFQHVTSSPTYAQSNGFIERTIQTVKRTLQKCKEVGADPHLAMLCIRTTPVNHNLPSPAEMLNGRIYKSNLPRPGHNNEVSRDTLGSSLQDRQDRMKEHYDTTAHGLKPLHPGDAVRVLNAAKDTWEPAVVSRHTEEPRSYIITKPDGSTLRRNRRHLRPTGEAPVTNDQSMACSQPYCPPPQAQTPVSTEGATALPKPVATPRHSPGGSGSSTSGSSSPSRIPLRRSGRTSIPPKRLDL